MKPDTLDDAILRELVDQVAKAAGNESERSVTTVITRPMWEAWCRATGTPENTEPTEWRVWDCHRVYGSETIVIESPDMAAVSFVGRYSA